MSVAQALYTTTTGKYNYVNKYILIVTHIQFFFFTLKGLREK